MSCSAQPKHVLSVTTRAGRAIARFDVLVILNVSTGSPLGLCGLVSVSSDLHPCLKHGSYEIVGLFVCCCYLLVDAC